MNPIEPEPVFDAPPAPLGTVGFLLRFGLIGVIIAGLAVLFLYVGGWFTPHALTPTTMIDRFEQVGGKQPGFRRNHAKGVCVSGYFESNGHGADYSKALVFQTGRTPVIGRVSLAGGQPYQADAAHTVRSLALLFKLSDGEEWRTAMINLPVFPVNSPEGFYDLLLASAPDPATGKPDPAKMGAFLAKYPATGKALQLISSQPASSGFADSTYNGLNAFRFINAQGTVTPVRWSMVHVEPYQPFDAKKAALTDTNFLFDAFIEDVHRGPVQWHLILTLGQPGDSTADATVPWPPDRQQVDVGTLTIDRVESEENSPVRDINFDPLVLPSGIAGSDDPLLSARSAAYAVSFERRESEHKQPSAVSPAETGK
jgi:catalase